MILADSTIATWLSTGFAAVAAIAAVIAIYYARDTVGEAKRTGEEATQAHRDLLDKQRALLDETQAARRDEVELAARVFNRELLLERVDALVRIAARLQEIARQAGSQAVPVSEPQTTSMGIVAKRLEVEIAIYLALQGEPVEKLFEFARTAPGGGQAPIHIVGDAHSNLELIAKLAQREGETVKKLAEQGNQHAHEVFGAEESPRARRV